MASAYRRARPFFSSLLMLLVVANCVDLRTVGADDVRDCCGVTDCRLIPPEFLDIGDDMARLAEQSTFVFIGKLVKAESVPCCDSLVELTYRASKVWKGLGLSQTTLVIHTVLPADRPCMFAIGQEYLVATLGSQDTKGRYALHPGFWPRERSDATQLIQALDDWRRSKYDASQSK